MSDELGIGWQSMENAPTDQRQFLVGMWQGEKIWNEDYTHFAWAGKPVFVKTLSHDESHSEHYGTRGWNHRNGAFGGNASVWYPLPDDPDLTDTFVEKLNASI